VNLTDPSGLQFGWDYGNFCSAGKKAICPPGSGPLKPIDAVDAACERHDCCHNRWWTCNPYHISKCSGALCQEVLDAWHFGCVQSWGTNDKKACECQIAALEIGLLFCPLTLLVRLGFPFGFDTSQTSATSPCAAAARPGLRDAMKEALE
jgi:hypothetical protein